MQALASQQFKIGDKAVYAAYGVGEVMGIEKRDVAGNKRAFYVLKILDSGMKVLIPTDSAKSAGLREVMSKKEAAKVMEVLESDEIAVEAQPWNRRQREYLDMLGLWPLPAKTPLKATVTATFEHQGVTIDNLHFQSKPGLYVTANLYRPKGNTKKLPSIVYVWARPPDAVLSSALLEAFERFPKRRTELRFCPMVSTEGLPEGDAGRPALVRDAMGLRLALARERGDRELARRGVRSFDARKAGPRRASGT